MQKYKSWILDIRERPPLSQVTSWNTRTPFQTSTNRFRTAFEPPLNHHSTTGQPLVNHRSAKFATCNKKRITFSRLLIGHLKKSQGKGRTRIEVRTAPVPTLARNKISDGNQGVSQWERDIANVYVHLGEVDFGTRFVCIMH